MPCLTGKEEFLTDHVLKLASLQETLPPLLTWVPAAFPPWTHFYFQASNFGVSVTRHCTHMMYEELEEYMQLACQTHCMCFSERKQKFCIATSC